MFGQSPSIFQLLARDQSLLIRRTSFVIPTLEFTLSVVSAELTLSVMLFLIRVFRKSCIFAKGYLQTADQSAEFNILGDLRNLNKKFHLAMTQRSLSQC